MMQCSATTIILLLAACSLSDAFLVPLSQQTTITNVNQAEKIINQPLILSATRLEQSNDDCDNTAISDTFSSTGIAAASNDNNKALSTILATSIATAVLSASMIINPVPVGAYVDSDYASDTVQEVVKRLKDSSGNIEETFKTYESIAEIITEGAGVGGMINYEGVKLERGYIADEDTSIYNPGLTLLTESEKERLVEAVIESRKDGLSRGKWSENNEYAFQFLREKLDPFHTNELSGYLKFVPFYGAILYAAVLAVQQFFRDVFPLAYAIGVVAFFGPIILLVLNGP